jgi:Ca-activated chloride channel family protein
MKTEIYAELKGEGKLQPVFEGLQVKAELRETLAITTITQSYRNTGSKNIEAIYTFPLPLDAVLLEMIVTLGDKTLKGTVLPKQEAEEKYEEAITDGDAPVMLQNPQPGVYIMNVGNLLPGERAQITISYGMFARWQGDSLRYHLPTTIAPRYGSAEQAGLESHQEPETSLLAEYLFAFELKVCGVLAGMTIASPSHEIAIERNAEGKESMVGLVRKTAFMDRDLIITIKKTHQQTTAALMERDGDEFLVWASFQPQSDLAEDAAACSIKIVVDCSGSMGGDSIAQARLALLRVLDELRPQDWFNVVAFGCTATPLFNSQTKADSESLAYARGFLKKLDANMGGTEIGTALEMAARLRCPEQIQQDVLLITDGEIWEWEKVVSKAVKSKHRFFTVGVGSSVSEAFVRTLADRTGGACELVSPNENMADRIHRHFKRIGTPRSSGSEVVWPVKPIRFFPEVLPNIYDGDTCNLFAWFAEAPVGEIQLKVSLPDNSERVLTSGIGQSDNDGQDAIVSRMAAALKLREITEEKAGQVLAVKYQLVSRWTNYLAIVVRKEDDNAKNLPELHKVQQMLAAGWGAFGSTLYSASDSGIRFCRSSQSVDIAYDMPTLLRKSCCDALVTEKSTTLYQSAPPPHDNWLWDDHYDEMERFIELLDMTLTTSAMPTTIHFPLLPAEIESILERLVDEGFDERTVVTVFLHHLAGSAAGSGLSRQAKRVIAKAHKELRLDRHIAERIEKRLKDGMDEDVFDIPTFLRNGKRVGSAP